MKICIATSDLMGPIKNGGVGTASSMLAELLAKNGNHVDILFLNSHVHLNDSIFEIWKEEYSQKKINLLKLKIPNYKFDQIQGYVNLAYLAYLNLKNTNYDIVIFPEMHGLGYYCIRAKKLDLDFLKTELVVMYHGPTEWHLKHNNGMPTTTSELVLFYLEKQTCLGADKLFFSTEHAKKSALELGYLSEQMLKQSIVQLYPFENVPKKTINKNKIDELVFFGRLETRKGLKFFLNYIASYQNKLKRDKIKITLLGVNGFVDSTGASQYLEKWKQSNNIALEISQISNYGQAEAIDYLKNQNCLVVLPSLEETMGYTLIECITQNIPFICSDISPYQELLKYFGLKPDKYLFSLQNPSKLSRMVTERLGRAAKTINYKFDSKKFESNWIKVLTEGTVENKRQFINKNDKKISFCVVSKDRPGYLFQLVKSIHRAKSYVGEILIYDNGSEDKKHLAFLKKLEKMPKLKVFYSKKNNGPSIARNYLSQKSKHENLFFIDDDNVLKTETFINFYKKIHNDWDVIVSTQLLFRNNDDKFALITEDDLKTQSYALTIPIGDDLSMNLFENCNGDANFLIKKKHFLEIGGFDENVNFGEDQLLLIKSRLKNGNYHISPEPLIFYRKHLNNLSKLQGATNENHNKFNSKLSEHLGLKELHPFLNLLTAVNYEKSRVIGYQIFDVEQHKNKIHINKRSYLNKIDRKISNKTELNNNYLKIITNQFKKVKKTKVLNSGSSLTEINLTIFAGKNSTVIVESGPVKLSSGLNNVKLKTHQKINNLSLRFYSEKKQFLYLTDFKIMGEL